ncbi:LamG domain-containing protein [Streptomyces venezuelae]|uniref:LamG domain-containing protein n=1 Tax=Streptomyces venezuelae TaxID=54571 RepID=UPI001CCF2A80|nr:LamG domain-containing protein [Streptomyces venezuelae]
MLAATAVLSVFSPVYSNPDAALAASSELPGEEAATPESAASEAAAETGQRTEVLARTTETSQVFANPDGTFTKEMSAAPVRAQKDDGSWAAIDTTLFRTGDGRVETKATVNRVEFSGGGSDQPMATVSKTGKELSLAWPGVLPEPDLDGSTATYREVFPGVDLKLSAVESGFTQTLVVKTAEAAQNPALESVQLGMESSGVRYTPGRDGGMRFVDADGRTVFESPGGQMWDSSGDVQTSAEAPAQTVNSKARSMVAEAPSPSAPPGEFHDGGAEEPFAAPSTGDKTAGVAVELDGETLELKPDLGLLRSGETVYPVYIDPPVTGLVLTDWTALRSDGVRYWEFTGDKGVGYCSNYAGYLCSSTPYTQRMYFEYPMASLYGKKILDATWEVYQTWSFTCTQHNYVLIRVGDDRGISSTTTWGTKPAYVDMMGDRWAAQGRGDLCSPAQPANWLRYSDNVAGGETYENLTPTLQSFADGQKPNFTLELRAQDESTTAAWARFRNDATLSVTYASKPTAPTSVGVRNGTTGRACNTSSTPLVTSSKTPKLTSVVQSPDGARARLRALYEVWKADGSGKMFYAVSPTGGALVADDAVTETTSPTLADNTTYRMRVLTEAYWVNDRGASGLLQSPWSTWCYFRVDTTSPPPPIVTSDDGLYPPAATGGPSGAVGKAGRFRFTPTDTNPSLAGIQSDVTSYKWRLNSGPLSAPINVSTGASTTLWVTPNQDMENTLQVWAYDAAMHSSVTAYYSFKVDRAEAPVGKWSLDNSGADSTTAATKRALTLGASAVYGTKSRAGSHALQTDGTTSYATTSSPPVNTLYSYSVSAWARADSGETGGTVVGIDGKVFSGFYLAFDRGRWCLLTSPLDTTSGNISDQKVVSKEPATTGVWTHLAGVYDSVEKEMRLYVNGRLQGTDSMPASWQATGGLQIGRGLWQSNYDGYFAGSIDEVTTWSRALDGDEVAQIATQEDEDDSDGYTGDPTTANVASWDATTATGTTIQDASGYGRAMTLNGATIGIDPATADNEALGLPTTNAMALNGSSGYASAPGPLVDDTGSFTASAWVRLDSSKVTDTSKGYLLQVLGQQGTSNFSWGIWYEQAAGSSAGMWKLGRSSKDVSGSAWSYVSSAPAVKDQWVRLTVVYDAQDAITSGDGDEVSRGTLFLYVNSAKYGSDNGVAYTTPWQGLAKFEVGRGIVSGTVGRYFPGHVRNVRVWAGAMSPSAVGDFYATEQE